MEALRFGGRVAVAAARDAALRGAGAVGGLAAEALRLVADWRLGVAAPSGKDRGGISRVTHHGKHFEEWSNARDDATRGEQNNQTHKNAKPT